MSVKLRKRKYKDKERYYLDIYYNGKRQAKFLDLYYSKGGSAKVNKEHKELAEQIRATRQLEIQSEDFEISPKNKSQIFFLDYFDQWVKTYPNKDVRLAISCQKYFHKFIKDSWQYKNITPKQVTKELAKKFRAYLDEHLNGETPYNYYGKFIKLCNDATEDKIFSINPCRGIKNTRPEGLKKDILTIEEIKALRNTSCTNNEIKKAFLLSMYTGLRWIDVKEVLKWKNIDGDVLKLFQSKTRKEVVVYLNDASLALLPERGERDELVFNNLPSHTTALKTLDNWVKAAKINKKITWHSARHTFAVLLLSNNVDVKTMSSLLGHSGLKHTEKYTRVVDELKRDAIKNLNF